MTIEEEINKVFNYKTWTVKRKVDRLLEIDATMYTNLGIESTERERKKTKAMSKKIYKMILNLSSLDGFLLRAHMDETIITVEQ